MRSIRYLAPSVLSSVVVTVGLAAGCPPDEIGDDDIPPRVVGVEPVSPIVPVTTTFTVSFSEELNEDTVDADVTSETISVLLAPRFAAGDVLLVNEAFLTDVDNPPLSESRQGDVTPIVVSLVDGSAITIAPRSPLLPGTAYTLIISSEIRDTAGNPVVDAAGLKTAFLWEFSTDAGPPAVAETDVDDIVVPNRKRITVTFNQPVIGVDTSTLRIDGNPAPVIESILMEADRRSATIVLATLPEGVAGCDRLEPFGDYTLIATAGILGDTGQALTDFGQPFSAGGSCDLEPNIISGLDPLASEVTATIRFTTSKPGTTEVRFGFGGDNLDCPASPPVPCPIVGLPTTVANGVHNVTITGLTVDVDYDFRVFSEDEVGFVASADGTMRTEALPKIAINEALADVEGTGLEDQGEFVELANFGEIAIDLSGWKLRITKVADGAVNEGILPSPAPIVAADDFLVLGHPEFDVALYAGLDEDQVFAYSTFDSLVADPIILELVDPGNRPVSSMTLPSASDGQSYERRVVEGPDDADNVCSSREDVGPTPGRTNGVTETGCE